MQFFAVTPRKIPVRPVTAADSVGPGIAKRNFDQYFHRTHDNPFVKI